MKEQKSLWHRVTNKIAATRLAGWYVLNIAHHLDRWLIRLTNGRLNHGSLIGQPDLLLTTIGAKSGQKRTTPLIYYPDGDNIILIASNAGQPRNPSWYYNLKANPEVTLAMGSDAEKVYLSREVMGDEREKLWAKAAAQYAGILQYQTRTNGRLIPVIYLTPV